MKKSIIAVLFLLFSGIAFSQTTVTLQDQCNCEVLKGTAVSSAGAVSPTGADTGDIYVNTNTGTIYFWDGDSWELTSSDNQQLNGFTFDSATNTLTLSLENGGSVNVDLSSLSDTLTDTNTTVSSFGIDGTNTNLVITDSDGNNYAVALADIAALIDTDTDDQNLSEVLGQGNDAGGNAITNLANPTNPQDAATKSYVDGLSDDDITGASLDAPTNVLTISEGTTDVTVDLSDLDDSAGVSTNATNIATNTGDIATNAADIAAHVAADLDTNVGNEYNTGVGLSGTSITVTDGGGTLSQDLDGVFATDAELAAVSDDDVSVTNIVAGNRIATISEPGIAAVDINETVTSLSQNTSTGVISYTDEDGGTPATANVVSTDANNELTVGADGGASFEMSNIDMDGDGATEDTVDDAMTDIAKVTAKAGRIFYPPSIAIDASTNGTGRTVDLYAQYVAQYGTPAVASSGAPVAIPTYSATDLYYYVTYADSAVFANMSIDANGVLTYDIIGQPSDYNALINVVFVVK